MAITGETIRVLIADDHHSSLVFDSHLQDNPLFDGNLRCPVFGLAGRITVGTMNR